MLVTTTVVSATNINMKENNNKIVNSEPSEPGLFDWWSVDQKQTHTDGSGLTLYPPEINAQSFTPTKDKLTAVALWLFKYANPPEPNLITVSIRDNITGPDLATKTINTSVITIGGKGTWTLFDFDDISITPETKYYIVCTGTAGDPGNAYCWLFSANDTYTQGDAWYKANENFPWNINNGIGDFCFKTYFRKPLDVSSTPQTIPSTPQASMTGDWTEGYKIHASDPESLDYFGTWLVTDGDTALISAMNDDDNGDNSGSVYVFIRNGTTWTQQAKLIASDGAAGDNFCTISISNDTALIGAFNDDDNGVDSGSAYVFTRTGTTWTQQAKLIASDGAAGDNFGYAVSVLGDTALIGAYAYTSNGTGSVYAFTRTGTTWTQQQKILAPDPAIGDRFGGVISRSGDTALICAYRDDDYVTDSGSVYVYTLIGTTWTLQQKLTASDGSVLAEFGRGLSLDGDTALIGSPLDDDNGQYSGSAYIFTRTGTTWTQKQKLTPSDGATNDYFSDFAVSLDGDTAFIGAWGNSNNGVRTGSAYVFTNTGTTWTQQQNITASDGAGGDQFGCSVSLDGDIAMIAAWYDDDHAINSGSVYVFTKVGLTFSIAGGLGVKAMITNEGTTDATDMPWQIYVEGGMLGMINKTVNGTIDIPAGDTVTVSTGMILGFGKISIIAKVADEEQTATGFQIIIFSMVSK